MLAPKWGLRVAPVPPKTADSTWPGTAARGISGRDEETGVLIEPRNKCGHTSRLAVTIIRRLQSVTQWWVRLNTPHTQKFGHFPSAPTPFRPCPAGNTRADCCPTPPNVLPCAWRSTTRVPGYPRAPRGLTCSPFQSDPGPDHMTQAQTLGHVWARHLVAERKLSGRRAPGSPLRRTAARGRRRDQPDLATARNPGPLQYNRARTSGRGLPRRQWSFAAIDDGLYLQTTVPFGMRVAGWPFVLRQ